MVATEDGGSSSYQRGSPCWVAPLATSAQTSAALVPDALEDLEVMRPTWARGGPTSSGITDPGPILRVAVERSSKEVKAHRRRKP